MRCMRTVGLFSVLTDDFFDMHTNTYKLINSPSAFVDMSVWTTSACCEKPDKNSDSQVISNCITVHPKISDE
ncbi:conserved hypothetical protein [Trichinella spiralis]|uniref:hypothetical protein n=1 Tax=Trichinella spiralis TaxID=6334 RepID=UPI0001EFC742|nr:conserved hypothetical protein [Trichinella spiralis]